jgi:hypothetical protein
MIRANNANSGGRGRGGSWHGSREVVCAVAPAIMERAGKQTMHASTQSGGPHDLTTQRSPKVTFIMQFWRQPLISQNMLSVAI